MSVYQIFYLIFLTSSLAICLYSSPSFEHNKSLKVFPILLFFSVFTEAFVNILRYVFNYSISSYQFIYHLYIPIEYTLLSYFFYLNNNAQVRKYIMYSVPFYILVSGLLSLKIITFANYPGLNFNLEGVLLIAWSLITLFSVQPSATISIIKLPVFWICLGILIFHAGIFFFNNVYDELLQQNSVLAQNLHRLIIKSLNYILYICFSIAFICSNQMKKYLLPS